MLQKSVGLLAALAVTFGVAEASAHIKLNSPAPRFVYASDGQKVGPCGSGTESGDITEFAPGDQIMVEWQETVNHPGHFRIALDPDGGEDGLEDPTDYDDFDTPNVLEDNIPDNGGASFSRLVTLPNVECEKCTLQLIQVMTDKPPWGPEGGNDIYYWCADIKISASVPPTSVTTGAGGSGSGDGGSSSSTPSSGGSPSNGGASGDGGNGSVIQDNSSCAASPASTGTLGMAGALALLGLAAATRRRR